MIRFNAPKLMKLRLFSLIAAIGASILLAPAGSAQELPYQIFERYLEPLAQQIGMPGPVGRHRPEQPH